jgi:hypothetical protein
MGKCCTDEAHGVTDYSRGWLFWLTGLFEGSLLRGYLQFTLARGIGFWWAALLLSLGFCHALAKPWRIPDRHYCCGSRWTGVLLESMADHVTLLGCWVACRMGLGPVLYLRSAGQRPGF